VNYRGSTIEVRIEPKRVISTIGNEFPTAVYVSVDGKTIAGVGAHKYEVKKRRRQMIRAARTHIRKQQRA
jgi:hypothetical protein